MKMADIGLFDECFTHADDGTQTTYAATALFKFCEDNPDKCVKQLIPVEHHHAKFCVEQRGVEQDRLEALMQNGDWLKKPILFIHMPSGSHLLVDGTHRYVCYFALSLPQIPAYIVPWDYAKDFVVEDAPKTTTDELMQYSGLAQLRKMGFGS